MKPNQPLFPPHDQTALQAMRECLSQSPDPYVQLNSLRDWINAHYPGFELYLEDVWNERQTGETDIQYILRSLETLNETDILGYDIYQNHRDAKGVWHLDDYVTTIRLVNDPQTLLDFIHLNQTQ